LSATQTDLSRRLAAFALVFADMTNALFNPDNGIVLSDAERYLIYFGLLAGEFSVL